MTTAQPQCRTCARFNRWFSTGRGSARPNVQPSYQIVRESSSFMAGCPWLKTRIAAEKRAGSSHPRSQSSAAAIKSP
jgi:hypothetical protein